MAYAKDPYWTLARYDGKDANGKPLKKGTDELGRVIVFSTEQCEPEVI